MVLETIRPTIRYRSQIIQMGEVILAKPDNPANQEIVSTAPDDERLIPTDSCARTCKKQNHNSTTTLRADATRRSHMARMTIDFGIDLGTTNSSIAVLKGTEVEVFKNNEGC